VAFATLLVFAQLAVLRGYSGSFVAIVDRAGGDVWVMARGTDYLDAAELVSPAGRAAALAQPCVERARPLVFAESSARRPTGRPQLVRVIGAETAGGAPLLPWRTEAGTPLALRDPMRVSVDRGDLEKLGLPPAPTGARLEIAGASATVALVSRGTRSGSTLPFVFADVTTARRLAGVPDGAASFWLLDLRDPSCAAGVIAAVGRAPGLQAVERQAFSRATEAHWLEKTGIGAALSFVAALGLFVGGVVVGQIQFALVRRHERELATLRALGAGRGELARFVLWQAGFLAAGGVALGAGASALLGELARSTRLTLMLPSGSIALALGLLAAMCAVSCGAALRRALRIEPASVFG
jgi:putative ABC transport system permease protein